MNIIDEERTVLITGATSGIGEATAFKFASEGFNLALVGRNKEKLQLLSEELSEDVEVLAIPCDLTKRKGLERIVPQVIKHFERLDVLVNSAGIILLKSLEDTSFEDWRQIFSINVDAIFLLMKSAVPFLIETGGSIVNVSSVAGKRVFPGIFAYNVTKAAVDQLTRAAAIELASKGVRVNAVNPGVVETELHTRAGLDEKAYEEFLESCKKSHPLGRPGEPEEIAELIYYLASPRSAWITGETVSIDGGRFLTALR